MTESTKPESPPAEQAAPAALSEGPIPSTSGTGALLSEVSSMRTVLSDQIEQMSIEMARMGNSLKESQRLTQKVIDENKALREALESLNDRQNAADVKLGESKQVSEIVAVLVESRLPMASLIRVAQNYQAGQDIHAKIQQERDYAKKLFRESERGELNRPEPSGLGLIESAMQSSNDYSSSTSPEQFSEIEDVLSGKGW